jgi:hypothetical protein
MISLARSELIIRRHIDSGSAPHSPDDQRSPRRTDHPPAIPIDIRLVEPG